MLAEGGYTMIENALKAAGLLAANATEQEFMTLFNQICANLARASAATGEALSEGQIAKLLAEGGGFTKRVAETIKTTRNLQSIAGAGPIPFDISCFTMVDL